MTTGAQSDADPAVSMRPRTRCIPPSDPAFVRAVDLVVAEIEALGEAEPRSLEIRLRSEYPRARIVARQVRTPSGGPGEVRWYALRDGAPPAPLDFE